MNVITIARKITPATIGFLLVLGFFNTGSSVNQASQPLNVANPNVAEAQMVIRTCDIQANVTTVNFGSDLTISWQTQGYTNLTVNGQNVSGPNGSRVFTNIQANTTYTLQATDGNNECTASVTVLCIPVPPPTCTLTPTSQTIRSGESVTLVWTTTNAASASLTTFGNVPLNGNRSTGALTSNQTYTLSVVGTDGTTVNCPSTITVEAVVVPPPTCTLTPTSQTIRSGESVTLAWTTTNAASASLTPFGNVAVNGNRNTGALTTGQSYTLSVLGNNGTTVNCVSTINIENVVVPAPTCVMTPTSQTIRSGESVTLVWTTTNAASASLTTFGNVPVNGNRSTGALTTGQTYTLSVLGNNGTTVNCLSTINIETVVVPAPTCVMTPTATTINYNESVNLQWSTTNAASASLTSFGSVAVNGSQNTGALTTSRTYILTVTGNNGSTVSCQSIITVNPQVIPAPTCVLTPTNSTILSGESVTFVWTTTNAASASLTTFGNVPVNGNRNTGALTTSQSYTLSVLGNNGSTVSCQATVTVNDIPPPLNPVCESFTATPATVVRGASVNLNWATRNATRVVIDNAIGQVNASGTISVTPLATTEFTLTVYGQNNQQVSCSATVTVTNPPVIPVPDCIAFTATPATLPAGGGNSVLNWQTSNATSVNITPNIGLVAANGSTQVSISTTTTYTLVASVSATSSDSCIVRIEVAPVVNVPISCQSNVTFTANPNSIRRGDSTSLSWTTTGITSVSFDQGITANGLSGSVNVSPNDSTTYTMTATDGRTTISCPVPVSVSGGGGGGGGSSSPSCQLSISRNTINRGEEVTLRWNTSRATNIEIRDSFNKILVTTNNLLSKDKSDLFDGSIKISPTRDTKYRLIAERGSKDDECIVSIDVKDTVVVSQVRNQLPLITGISLAEVPYTGFEAGPILTMTFYLLLVAWALYMAYLMVIRRDVALGHRLPEPRLVASPEAIRPDLFVSSVTAPEVPPSYSAPLDLPVGTPVIGYANVADQVASISSNPNQTEDQVVTEIENHAHTRKVLLSSDAIRHFMGTTQTETERINILDEVISLAKSKFPSEDGWIVINENRMRDLCVTSGVNEAKSSQSPFVPTIIPEGSGSLAEAIVTGNIVAAYEMIGHRPMFALADASADLDAVYRSRKGASVNVSNLLATEAAKLSDEQIMKMIEALTGALDGVYTDEASAVKMAIMKAVKVAA